MLGLGLITEIHGWPDWLEIFISIVLGAQRELSGGIWQDF
jgi:hypothetical protein